MTLPRIPRTPWWRTPIQSARCDLCSHPNAAEHLEGDHVVSVCPDCNLVRTCQDAWRIPDRTPTERRDRYRALRDAYNARAWK